MHKTSVATTAIDSALDTKLPKFTFHDRRGNLHLSYQAHLSSSVGELDEMKRCHMRRGPCSRDRAFRVSVSRSREQGKEKRLRTMVDQGQSYPASA